MSLPEERRRRIVTTHVGSLPRPPSLSAKLLARSQGQRIDAEAFGDELGTSVRAIVRQQSELDVDVVSDGEFSKISFQYYVTDRLGGIEPITPAPGRRVTRENSAFPTFYRDGAHSGTQPTRFACTGPILYTGQAQLAADIANLKGALAGSRRVDAFMPSVSPSSCVGLMENRYYKTPEEHLYAVAEALREEYQAIVAAGFMLQIDDPRLAMHYMLNPGESVDATRAWARRRIEALNHALRDLPPERVRHHTCYGINMGPRTSDIELKHLADLIVTIRAGYYSFEMANPRHEHEWRVWESVKLPDGKVLMPGCITHASVIVEHPELVAERVVRLAKVVGRERVMASSDCGFASTLNPNERPEIEPEIVWAKFASLAEGARLATKMLWG
ncbi:MAG TPA: cobalamin-independent methionine synthase II family protein [Xanthobacteraceae bacterium]|nr:cobalamin-independent methionine synthase II family protein [Xanthobacteraceae bacterium]